MGYNIEARNHEIPSPYTNRVNHLKRLLGQVNAEVNAFALQGIPAQDHNRSATAEQARLERLRVHASFLNDRRQGFARQHVEIAAYKSLLLAATRNQPDPKDVYFPKADMPITQLVFAGSEGTSFEDTISPYDEGVCRVLTTLSDPYIGLIEQRPFIPTGTYETVTTFDSGLLFTRAITNMDGIEVHHLGHVDSGGRMRTPQLWFNVSQVPTSN